MNRLVLFSVLVCGAHFVAGCASASPPKERTAARSAPTEPSARRGAEPVLSGKGTNPASKTDDEVQAETGQLTAEKQVRDWAEAKAKEALDRLSMAAPVAVKDEPRGIVVALPARGMFAPRKAELLPGAGARLELVADALRQESDNRILVEGHTDALGSEGSNTELSRLRANAVRDYLVSHGVRSDRVTAAGIGETRPVSDNATHEGRANNSRVEIVVEP